MYIKVIRGIGQIGGNIIEVGTESTKIILDCGKELAPILDKTFVDTMNIGGLMHGEKAYDAVFISHYHGDHIGLVDKILPTIPVYASLDTINQVEKIAMLTGKDSRKITPISKKITVGDISVTPFPVKHSATGAYMYLVEGDGKRVLYSGDFSAANIAEKDIDVLLCEGTNIGFTTKTKITEDDVTKEVKKVLETAELPTFLITSTANYDRIKNLTRLCMGMNRPFVSELASYVLIRSVESDMQRQMRPMKFYMHNYIDSEHKFSTHLDNFKQYYIKKEELPSSKALILVRKNELQIPLLKDGKPIKGQYAIANMIKDLSEKGKVKIIYSTWTGYKEEPKFGGALKKFVDEYGAEIIDIHASGHIFKEELIEFIKKLAPKTIIPIHTENEEVFGEEFKNVVNLTNDERYEV